MTGVTAMDRAVSHSAAIAAALLLEVLSAAPPIVVPRSPLVLFGAQSGRPSEADAMRTLETAKAAGFSDFLIYPRSGLEYEYMGEEWLSLVGHYLKHAERLGMGIWLYDEFNFPSGSCRGAVPRENPDFRHTFCAIYQNADGSFDWRLFRSRLDATNTFYAANVYDADAMARFMEMTHAVYERRFRRYFGTVIRGIFSDEPGDDHWTKFDRGSIVQFRWYRALEEDYRAETGRDFRADMEAYCRDRTKTRVWEDYAVVLGHALRRAFIDPITAWCDQLGIVSTGHLTGESDPYAAASCHGLTLHALKGFSYPGIDEIFTHTTPETAEWLTFATAQHAIGRRGNGGLAELFALGPCDLTFAQMNQMIWLVALHKVDTYVLCLHHQTARGFATMADYAMFQSPVQPWFEEQAEFHESARMASSLARKPFVCDIAVRYPQRQAMVQKRTRNPKDYDLALVELLRTLDSGQTTCDLYEEDEQCDKPILFDIEGRFIVERKSGCRFDSGAEALAFVRKRFPEAWRAETAEGAFADGIVLRRYEDGSAALLDMLGKDRALVFKAGQTKIPFLLPGRGCWMYRPVAEEWTLTLDRGNCRRIRFMTNGTARVSVERPVSVRFAMCAISNVTAQVTLDGKPLVGTKPAAFLGFGYDRDYVATEPMLLESGEHLFGCQGREDRGLFLPILWMEGAFAVREPRTIIAPPSRVTLGSLVSQGYADFAGRATYRAEVCVPSDASRIFGGTGCMPVSMRLGGVELGTRILPPWELPVPCELRGKRLPLEISVTTSIRPRFGASPNDVPGAFPAKTWGPSRPIAPDAGLLYVHW